MPGLHFIGVIQRHREMGRQLLLDKDAGTGFCGVHPLISRGILRPDIQRPAPVRRDSGGACVKQWEGDWDIGAQLRAAELAGLVVAVGIPSPVDKVIQPHRDGRVKAIFEAAFAF